VQNGCQAADGFVILGSVDSGFAQTLEELAPSFVRAMLRTRQLSPWPGRLLYASAV